MYPEKISQRIVTIRLYQTLRELDLLQWCDFVISQSLYAQPI